MKTFGDWLREYRLRGKYTQQELADRLGLSSPYIAQMESGFKPPPPRPLVEKMAALFHLRPEEHRQFAQLAEKQRELQSLVKAARKIGFVLAGNKVCVPRKAIAHCLRVEIGELVNAIPHKQFYVVDRFAGAEEKTGRMRPEGGLQTHEDLRGWVMEQLGDQPPVWLVFLGLMHEVLQLTTDEQLLTRQPSERRREILQRAHSAGTFCELLHKAASEAKERALEQKFPDVIAPHEMWNPVPETGEAPGEAAGIETIPRQIEGNAGIRNIPVTGVIRPGSEEMEEEDTLDFLGLPKTWFDAGREYEAIFVQTDSYMPLGIWPGCKVIYEVGGLVRNEDLVVAWLEGHRCVRKYFDLGNEFLLQGGPLTRPVRVSKSETAVRIEGVIRELISRFRDMRS
ncbi:MAG: helix-turn-helix domain-containing protein [bacterium]